MNVAERNNSLRGYFTNLKESFENFCDKIVKDKGTEKNNMPRTVLLFQKRNISFAAVMKKFLKGEDESSGQYGAEEFNALKFRLAKNLNLIQSLLYKLCCDTIDSSIISDESGIEEIKQAIVWQFVDCVDDASPAYQDLERIRLIARAGNGDKDELEDNQETIIGEYKEALRTMLDDLFDVLGNLVNFSQYLSVAEELSVYSPSAGVGDMNYLRTKPDMRHILILAETVKELILTYLVSYVKVKQLNLPHSFLAGARFSHSILYDSNLMCSELTDANFEQATLRNCDLSMCMLGGICARGADLTNATLNYVNLAGADLSNAVLNGAAINSVTFFNKRIISAKTYFQAKSKEKIPQDINESFIDFDKTGLPKGNIYELLDNLGRNSENELKKSTQDLNNRKTPLADPSISTTFHKAVNDCVGKYAAKAKTSCPPPEFMNWAETYYIDKKSDLDFSLADLTSASIKQSALPNSDFSYLAMAGATFDDTDLNECRFAFNDAHSARFSNANLGKCRLYHSDFSNATFSDAIASDAEFLDCRLSGVSFERALLIDARFFNSESKDLWFSKLIKNGALDDTGFSPRQSDTVWGKSVCAHADMQDCNLQRCIASGISLIGMNLDRSMCAYADMKKSFISNCLLRWVDMYKVNLSYALVFEVLFDHSSLNSLLASNARLFACVFSESNLADANFISCRMDNVAFDNCDLSEANISNARFVNCSFRNVNFSKTNMSKTQFINCSFDCADITQAKNAWLSIHKNSSIEDLNTGNKIKALIQPGKEWEDLFEFVNNMLDDRRKN